jgi:uncharacterized protein YbjT (DUF2867 family)
MDTKLILVTGATGQQGGAVARHLLKRPGFTVRALTRDAFKPSSQKLAQAGAKVVRGNLDDAASVRSAVDGVYGVFSVQNFMETGFEGEIRQGKTLAEVAKSAGVKHFVYSSVVSADRQTGLPHFESKWAIERHIRQIGLPYTILRPAFFMQNWHNYMRDQIQQGTLPLPLNPQTPLQQISIEDIGEFAAMAFENPGPWIGRTLEIAGEELTMSRVADVLTRCLGWHVNYVQVPWDHFRQAAGDEMTRMYEWFNDFGYRVNIPELRTQFPTLATLEQVLHQQNWKPSATEIRKAA